MLPLLRAFLALLLATLPALAAPKPNIIFILADDLGAHDLGCDGSSFHRTPSLDQLAARSLRFTAAYAAAPVCSPTRASLLTGLYPARLGLTDWLPGRGDLPAQRLARPSLPQGLPTNQLTVAKLLRSAGYTTAHVGKWHLGGPGSSPLDHGFDFSLGGNEAGSPAAYFAPYRRGDRTIPGLENAPDGEYLTDRLSAEAAAFIEQHRDRPFYLQLWHYAVHTPLQAQAPLVATYPVLTNQPGRQTNALYAAMLQSLDQGVGLILRTLDDLHLADRTVILFSSDNGGLATLEGPHTPATINAPLREGKGYLYEGGLRVPLIIHWPDVTPAGRTCPTPVSSVDFLPTLAEIAGAPAPAAIDGLSLVPLLRGQTPPPRDALYWHYPHYSNQGGRPGSALRAGHLKLIEFLESNRQELYDLASDPGEVHNLAPLRPDQVQSLAAQLHAWKRTAHAQPMTPNPAYQPHPPNQAGLITLPGRTADVHGRMLRFEPLPHKNTLGYWTDPNDWVSWEFEITQPGTFTVEVTQGCGNGSGGSQVEIRVGQQALLFTVQETGGFQRFLPRDVGTLTLESPGRHTLAVRALTKPGPAVMDLPQIRLKPFPPAPR